MPASPDDRRSGSPVAPDGDGPPEDRPSPAGRSGWTFLSNHGHVLACIAQDPEARVREIADRVGVTERAVMRILGDLDEAGVITRTRNGRRSRYTIDPDAPLRHAIESHRTVGGLLAIVAGGPSEPRDD